MIVTLALATLVGGSLALLGAGGSIITVPLLIYGARLDPHRAAATSLLVVGSVAAVATLLDRRAVRLGTAVPFALAGAVGTIPGVVLNHRLPSSLVLSGLGLTMLVAAARMRSRRTLPAAGAVRPRHGRAVAAGVAVGVMTGLFGVGGGFLIVPALVMALGLELRAAIATSLAVIALNSAAGLLGHAAYGGIEWGIGVPVTAAALLGGAVALPLGRRLQVASLQASFSLLLAVTGAGMLAQVVAAVLA